LPDDEDDEHACNKTNAMANQPIAHKEKSFHLLKQFLDSCPDVPRVSVVKELSARAKLCNFDGGNVDEALLCVSGWGVGGYWYPIHGWQSRLWRRHI
jgi:hypothetical protein